MPLASLDPVPLNELAEHLRDGTWLDMRVVERGLLRRVRLFEIRVRFAEEELAAEQEYLENEEVGRVEHIVPQDAVRWVRPSSFSLEDVPPPDRRTEEQKREDLVKAMRAEAVRQFDADPLYSIPPWQAKVEHGSWRPWTVCERLFQKYTDLPKLRAAVLAIVSHQAQLSVRDMLYNGDNHATTARRWCIRMIWELTDVPQSEIAYLFGYRSGGMAPNALSYTANPDRTKPLPPQQIAADYHRSIEQWMNKKWPHRRQHLGAASKQKKLL